MVTKMGVPSSMDDISKMETMGGEEAILCFGSVADNDAKRRVK